LIAFDTNYLLRHLLQDDPLQCARVATLMDRAIAGEEPIHLFDLVLMETCWVLESSFGMSRGQWCEILSQLLQDPAFRFDDSSRLWKAAERYGQGSADFDVYLIWGHAEAIGAELKTFDRKLSREIPH
jgi:predicted nucleic-acid-binding protein